MNIYAPNVGAAKYINQLINKVNEQPPWLSGLAPPSAQGVIPETWDLPAWSLLLPLPVSLPFSLSLCVTIINKLKNYLKKNKKNKTY